MKYVISESRFDDFIYEYLTKNYHPDYGWGPELHDFYREDLAKHEYFDFLIKDISAYEYYLTSDAEGLVPAKTLLVQPWLQKVLSELFGYLWEPVFVKWFEDNTGLEVEHFYAGNIN